ncbi:hypothetical protein [Flagellimonas myxillae]|uniref:hypothetical protein n=1 Tax=Flagellimonas myxillae TaxID=2942214 RepID=UPI00201ECF34|nr:hypothetical protein [Muricauda myxillae]MCL6268319.1 hypothetical protein [Muricauda myxillae]
MGQESKILKGKIKSDAGDVVGIVVLNTNQNDAVISNVDGEFEIPVRLNDTLVFSAVHIKRKVIPVNKAVFDSSYLVVSLSEFVNELSEVVLRPYNLSGSLDKDLTGLKLEQDVSAEALGLPNAHIPILTQSENKLNDADHGKFVYFAGLGFGINLNKILNRISGRTRMLKDRVRLDENYMAIRNVEKKYLDSLYIESLKIPQNRFYDFMYYCQVSPNFDEVLKDANDLALWEFILDKSKTYREENGLD